MILQELAQLSNNVYDTNILLEMDNSRDLDIDYIMKNVEAWYQNVAQGSKEEVNAFYENRVSYGGMGSLHLFGKLYGSYGIHSIFQVLSLSFSRTSAWHVSEEQYLINEILMHAPFSRHFCPPKFSLDPVLFSMSLRSKQAEIGGCLEPPLRIFAYYGFWIVLTIQ